MPALMPDPFASLIPDARAFLAELADNNSRDWFTANKSRYEDTLRTPALRLLDEVAQAISRRTGAKVAGKLFRPQRDVRFSKDKTPYKTHLHMLWSIQGAGAEADAGCALFFGIDPARCTSGGGVMGFSKPQITRWREAVTGTAGDEAAALVDILALKGFAARAPELKRTPAPYGQAHRHGDLLRRKSLTFWHELSASEQQTPMGAVMSAQMTLAPAFALLEDALQR